MSSKDIYSHGFDTQSFTEVTMKYLYITAVKAGKKYILEKLSRLPTGLHYTHINTIESNLVVANPSILTTLHDRLGHPGSIMIRRIIENIHGHPLKDQKIPQ